MSAKVLREKFIEVTSAGATVKSAWFYLGGNPWDVQFVSPTSLCGMEGSNDKLNFDTMTDMFNEPIDGLSSVFRVGLERPKWLRLFVALDIGAPQLHTAMIVVGKEQGG